MLTMRKLVRQVDSKLDAILEMKSKHDFIGSQDLTGSSYVSWKNVHPDSHNQLQRDFAEDLWNGRQSGSEGASLLLDVLTKRYKSGGLTSGNSELNAHLQDSTNLYKFDVRETIYECVELKGLYMIMVNGRNDSDLEKLATVINFPRGLPVLWKPREFIDIRGFHPKFQNDKRNNVVFDSKMLNDANELNFFLKWSGFLLHVIAFKYMDSYHWTVLTKKVAFKEGVPYFEWGRELVQKWMNTGLLKTLADKQTYIGGEALFKDDVHGYIVKQNDFIVTCLSQGSFVDLVNHNHTNQSANRLVTYKTVNEIIAICSQLKLPHDTGYQIKPSAKGNSDSLKQFTAELFENRDTMLFSTFKKLITDLSDKYHDSIQVIKTEGTRDHEIIVGDNLEGFVMNISCNDSTKRTYKVKLPYYTWRTFFLRTWIEAIYPKAAVDPDQDDEFSFQSASIPDIDVINQDTINAMTDYLQKWCCTVHGRRHFMELCKCAAIVLGSHMRQAVDGTTHSPDQFSTGQKFRDRLHILIADFVENSQERLKYINSFDQIADSRKLMVSTLTPTVFICVGPVGYGKSVSTLHLASLCRDLPVDVIDGDKIAGSMQRTLNLGDERNSMTMGAIWKSLIAGRIPLLSVGGAQVVDFIKENVVCNLKTHAQSVFGCNVTLLAAVMEDIPDRKHIEDITDKKGVDLDSLIDKIYSVPLQYTTDVVNARVQRGEEERGSNGANPAFMHKISTGNKRYAKEILGAADKCFSIPCQCGSENPKNFINSEVVGWPLIISQLTNVGPITGRFSQLRAVVFQKSLTAKDEPKAGHVTIFFKGRHESKEYITQEILDAIETEITSIDKISGKQCKMVLKKSSGAEDIPSFTVCDELTDGIVYSDIGTRIDSFETRNDLGTLDNTSHEHTSKIDADVNSWSMEEVMTNRLSDKMFNSEKTDTKYYEERAILLRKKQIHAETEIYKSSLKESAIIEAAYLPVMNDICRKFKPGKLAHVTIDAKKVNDMHSETVLQWFLSATPKPAQLKIRGANSNIFEFSTPRRTRDYTLLVNPTKINFFSKSTPPFSIGDLMEKQTRIEGNCTIHDEDTEFEYVGLTPIQ